MGIGYAKQGLGRSVGVTIAACVVLGSVTFGFPWVAVTLGALALGVSLIGAPPRVAGRLLCIGTASVGVLFLLGDVALAFGGVVLGGLALFVVPSR